MDVATVRAEIKAWEHAYRAKHGRHPTVQDIKDEPAIAEKYKLYKKLNKAKQATAIPAASSSSTRSSTPPKTQPSSIIPRSRAVKTDAPEVTSNPFSPVKNKSKQRDRFPPPHPHSPSSPRNSQANPFATPSKNKSRPRTRAPRSPSLDPFPPISSLHFPTQSKSIPGEKTAVSRARKRLRGEPVSPSPVKEKRPRVASHIASAFGKHSTLHDSDDDTAANTHPGRADEEDDEPFLDDSPVKQPTGSKAYKPLFAEAVAQDAPKRLLARTQSKVATEVTASAGRTKSRAHSPAEEDEDVDWTRGKIKSLDISLRAVGKGDADKKAAGTSSQLPFQPAAGSSKRASPPARRDDPSADSQTPSLIPPSPPPKDSAKTNPRYIEKSRGKAKAGVSRKKPKVAEAAIEEDADADSPTTEDDGLEVEIVPRRRVPTSAVADSTHEDWESIGCREDSFVADPLALTSPGKLEVTLPDELKRVLAISTDDIRVEDSTKVNLVKELVYGSRVLQYDAKKGGEIWDVGEEMDADVRAVGDEDEWEGEPVPWEVGEL
ncbi:hypothetical protein EIP91_006359 [Steccherinum ochraceum]|uniref:DNA replication regulator SLD2 n=1 Tax=Steccherinum ochraceum TaxID=92696 RepID=A0A4R0R8D6_9APHY|nr:hypothetical protein EIP91_006359 [Steccherinum ochraceum]